jgi:hypothetical protein
MSSAVDQGITTGDQPHVRFTPADEGEIIEHANSADLNRIGEIEGNPLGTLAD